MDRRKFVTAAGSALALAGAGKGFAQEAAEKEVKGGSEPFKVLFAPTAKHFGQHKTIEEYLGTMQQAHDAGFRAWEDNWLSRRSPGDQEKVGEFLRSNGMTMGVTVVTTGGGARWATASKEQADGILKDCHAAVEVAKRVGHKWFTLIPGARVEDEPLEAQLKATVDMMKRCSDIFDEAGLVYVMEPLSHPMGGKPVLLETFKHGYELAKLVDRPSCKLLADFYHQQQVGGDLIKNADECWDQIAYIQYGDVPGRKQPGTGEINYANVTKHIKDKGYTGVIGLEHGVQGSSQDLIDSYRAIDAVL
ncbi:TIM barrel protein [Roseibacillus persicicus]|uniref:TIM barrel protein n=1 Tax=Roseibacillus persicicus TaxID=454148 RepID=UPI00280E8B14|nr:TIM barrel protein [Roseibacillus persicicus]MDQ8191069.1 TIM barrel protein [Roseibacillus persicicus]